ncbi:GroES-like protein [Polyporus arcularius HHB13444]|uniref:GroES-like protein n=1 Tax=Polyporus arcularius HHB13444 TaxID=1314778 RepID=A0A5C3NRR8_9APHY|nr:GroES-like protein [Polyporus arcularius HHB13444]
MSATQKALYLTARAGQWVVGEAPIPRPGPKDVLVKVISAGLNPLDWKLVDSQFSAFIKSYPFISGTDGAGILEEVGADVTTLVKGDKILFQGFFVNESATFQQYCLVPAAITAKIPDNISFDQAASVPLGLATVVLALYNHDPNTDKSALGLRLPDTHRSLRFTPPWAEGGTSQFAGKPAFIIGGASSVGQYALQIAKLANFSPIITTASPRNGSLLTSLGATHILDRTLPTSAILAELPKLTAGNPLEFVFDAIASADTQALAYQAVAPGGSVVVVLPENIPAALKKPEDKKKVSGVAGNVHFPQNRKCGEELFARLTEWLEKGIIKPNKVEVLPDGLAGVPEGLARLEAGKVSGTKLIARPQETP